jgi:hypothetical protein
MPSRVATLIAALLVAVPQTSPAQQAAPVPAIQQLPFESWQPAAFEHGRVSGRIITAGTERKDWLIGGAVGAAAGIVLCTALSTMIDDSARGGLSFCPLDTYLIMGGAGFVLGAAIGAAF